jgi:hypothetical protein
MQLSFQPAFDPFHATFRIMRLLMVIGKNSIHHDQMRILDFYLVFPYRIDEIRLTPGHSRFRALSRQYADTKPYGEQPDREVLFGRMEPMQDAAFETLASNGFISSSDLRDSLIQKTDKPFPEKLGERLLAANKAQSSLMEFLELIAFTYPLSGPNGVKARTGLMEYRYDAA